MQLNKFLFKVIEQYGVRHTFGIPGDFALPLYASQEESKVHGVICTHEPNAVFAADAYARVSGLGVVLTTYGAGALNMVNPVAMAYAEKSPVIIISGAPDQDSALQNKAVHHLVRDYQTQIRIFKEICVHCTSLQSSKTAAEQILQAFSLAVSEQQPVYIEIPKNMMNAEIGENCLEDHFYKEDSLSDLASLEEAFNEIVFALEHKKNPVFHVGVGARRYRLKEKIELWSERCSIPVVTSVMGKGAFSETHPNFYGVFMGEMGDASASEKVMESDCVIHIGVIQSDVNTGFWTGVVDRAKSIEIDPHELRVFNHYYKNIHITDLVNRLAKQDNECRCIKNKFSEKKTINFSKEKKAEITPLDVSNVLNQLDLNQYQVLCDIGDSWFIGLELKANSFMASGYYASMGFAVPGALGAGLGNSQQRNLVLVGDGAFQMTGNEIATLQKYNVPTTIVLINNQSYKMLEMFDKPRSYYELCNWNYVQFAQALHCRGVQVSDIECLQNELHIAEAYSGVTLIEVLVSKDNHPPIAEKIRRFLA